MGPRCIIAQDTDIKGNVTIGSGTVIHPKAVIHVLHDGEGASIVIGNDCIIEELVQIVHSGKGTMVIGDANLFEVGCRAWWLDAILLLNTFTCSLKLPIAFHQESKQRPLAHTTSFNVNRVC